MKELSLQHPDLLKIRNDDHILNQGATDGVDRLTGRGDAFLR